jgi:hypothetical protein
MGRSRYCRHAIAVTPVCPPTAAGKLTNPGSPLAISVAGFPQPLSRPTHKLAALPITLEGGQGGRGFSTLSGLVSRAPRRHPGRGARFFFTYASRTNRPQSIALFGHTKWFGHTGTRL